MNSFRAWPENLVAIIIVIRISSNSNVMIMTDLKQPLQSKYLRLLARGARVSSAESVRDSHPDKDNH